MCHHQHSAHLRATRSPDIWKAQYHLQRGLTNRMGAGVGGGGAPFQCLNNLEVLGWNFDTQTTCLVTVLFTVLLERKGCISKDPGPGDSTLGNTWQMSSFPSRQGFPLRSILWCPRPKREICKWHLSSVWIYDAHGIQCSKFPSGCCHFPWTSELLPTSQVWICLSPPSVASPAATRKALSSVIVLESMPTAPKLKEKNCYDLSSDDSV